MANDRDLRHVGELMAIRMLLAECLADAARGQDSASAFLAAMRARLLRRTRDIEPIHDDPDSIVQAACAANIAQVLRVAHGLAIASRPAAPPAPPKKARARGRS